MGIESIPVVALLFSNQRFLPTLLPAGLKCHTAAANCKPTQSHDQQGDTNMATVTLKGTPLEIVGNLPAVGSKAPAFTLTGGDLADVSLESFAGKKLVLNIFPSIDTPTCATSVRKFNEKAAALADTVVLCISADLPFAQGRFCGAEGIENVKTLSTFRSAGFDEAYGVKFAGGPLRGLTARAVVVVDANGVVKHTELVGEVADEPNYDAALAAL